MNITLDDVNITVLFESDGSPLIIVDIEVRKYFNTCSATTVPIISTMSYNYYAAPTDCLYLSTCKL